MKLDNKKLSAKDGVVQVTIQTVAERVLGIKPDVYTFYIEIESNIERDKLLDYIKAGIECYENDKLDGEL